VWRISKDTSEVRKKSPDKIFYEKDLYTVKTVDGNRDLTIEYSLSRLESEFSKMRKNKLDKRLFLTGEDRLILCMFTMAMYGRTKAYGQHWSSQWKEVLDMTERIQNVMEAASPEQRASMSSALPADGSKRKNNSITKDEIQQIVEQPYSRTLPQLITEISLMLFKFKLVVLETKKQFPFITSDVPCIWFDPAEFQSPKSFGAGGLVSPTVEITLPISPTQTLLFGKKLIRDNVYLHLNDLKLVDEFNRRIRLTADKHFVSNSHLVRPGWL